MGGGVRWEGAAEQGFEGVKGSGAGLGGHGTRLWGAGGDLEPGFGVLGGSGTGVWGAAGGPMARFWGAGGAWNRVSGCWGPPEQGFGVLAGPRAGLRGAAGACQAKGGWSHSAGLAAHMHTCRTSYFLHLLGAWEMHGSCFLVFRKISQIVKHFSQKGAYSNRYVLMVACSSHRIISFS